MAPRLAAGRRAAPKTTTHPPNPRVQIGDNKPTATDLEEAERVQFISFLSRLSQADDAVEAARAPLKAAQKSRSQIVNLAKAAGFKGKDLERRLEEMRRGTRDMADEVKTERKQRRWAGIIDADQESLLTGDKAPQESKDEAHWKGEGYKAGLRQLSSTPPTQCPERFVQAYMHEHERGLAEVLQANAPKQLKPTTAEQAKADFEADNPEIDVAAAARKLKNDPAFMDRSAPDDGFEATEEELAQQIGRPTADADVV